MGHGQQQRHQAVGLLGAGAPVAAGGGVRDRRRALLDGARGLDADVPGIGGVPGAVRIASRPGLPADMAAGLAPRRLDDVGGARGGNGAHGGGTPRPAGDSRLGGRSQPPGLAVVVVAPRAGLKPAGCAAGRRHPPPRSCLPPPADGRLYVPRWRTVGRLRSSAASKRNLAPPEHRHEWRVRHDLPREGEPGDGEADRDLLSVI